ncbi:MAG TPA: sigma-70 family RNA polymerase sigma factor [Actinomycetota bacterium]|nr:sigma-70 family RNA polymerase sigma factor [Actinomycetota bacterium]
MSAPVGLAHATSRLKVGSRAGVIMPTTIEGSNDLTFDGFYETEFESVLRTAFLVVHDRAVAEEITQEAFAKAFASWWRVSRYSFPGAWVRKVALRMAIRQARRSAQHDQLIEQLDAPTRTSGGADLDLMRAINELPGNQRAAIVLFYLEDRPVAEVADLMDVSESTVKVHLHRARQKLAQQLGEEA